MKNRFINNQGVGLIMAILVVLIVAVMAAAIVSLITTNTSSSIKYMQSQQAFFLAESGIQKSLLQLSKGAGVWTGWSGTNPRVLQTSLTGYGDYDVSIQNPTTTTPYVTATGYVPNRTYPQATRVTYAIARKANLLGSYAAFAGASGSTIGVSMGGSSYTDSYDASLGAYNAVLSGGDRNVGIEGDIATNADVSVGGSAHIGGDVATGISGTFNNTSAVSGVITHDMNTTLTAVVVPSTLTGLASSGSITANRTINPGNYKYSAISLTGNKTVTIIGPANIYLTGSTSIRTGGGSVINVSPASTGPVVIYAAGNVSVGGGGVVNSTNTPINFQLYGSKNTTQTITMGGNAAFYGLVYAAKGSISLSGTADFYGSFIGNTVNASGGPGFHLDTSLATSLSLPSFVPGTYKQENWQEVY